VCSQSPWITSGTVRKNILLGCQMDRDLYERVLSACELNTDCGVWPNGDLTELGEHGINISGGQKARVSLARAAYSRSDINLLDDPLSAVDPAVANSLFEKWPLFLLIQAGNFFQGVSATMD